MERRINLDHLDGVRGLAALIVLFGHASNFGMDVIPGVDLRATAKAGVWLFFILSAYLLTRRLRDDMRTEPLSALKAYAIKRGFRILPLYALVLSFCAVAGWMTAGQAFSHIVLADGQHHFWTIVVEMTFYGVLPFAVVLLTTLRHFILFFALSIAISIAAGVGNISANSLALAPYIAFFAAGMLASVAPSFKVRSSAATAICAVAIISVAAVSPRTISFLFGITIEDALALAYLHILPWSALILLTGQSDACRALFGSTAFRTAGKLSFSAYLIHYPIFDLVAASQLASIPMIGMLGLIFVGLVSAGLYFCIEKPLMVLASKLASKQYRDRVGA